MTDPDRHVPGPNSTDGRTAPPPAPVPATAAPPRAGGLPVRGSVAIIAAVTLLAVLAILVWDGGDRSTSAFGGPGGGSGTPAASGEGFESGRSGSAATEQPQDPATEPGPTFEAAPLEPAQIAPTALLVDDRELAGAGYEWRLPGRVDSISQRYLDLFPQPGYEMKGGLGADHPSGQTIYVYTVNPIDDLSTGPVGTMYFMADPTDPQGQTRVGLKIGR